MIFLLQYVFWLFMKSYKIWDPFINISKNIVKNPEKAY